MKKVFRFFLIFIAIVLVMISGILIYVKTALPNVGEAQAIKIDYTPERIERGRYLANSVTVCMDCHSKRDYTRFSAPMVLGTEGMGGERFDQNAGLPGVFYSSNITPEGISRYTDGELVRVITTGVNKEGRAMFPLMPYPYYSKMDTEDIYSIVAYLRSLPAIHNSVPASSADFPMNFILNLIPKKAEPQTRPDKSDVLAYGAYLTNAAGCRECHTQAEKGQVIPELAFGGGREFKFPDGTTVVSSNITPDAKSGIGKWTKGGFVARFQAYRDSSAIVLLSPGDKKTIMPWTMYANMTTEDLEAVFTYLQSVKAISSAKALSSAKI